ncbi:MAG: winged helix-turn-helix transcriptional regulator [Sulfurimonas sp.]|nr:winged helix-turn-helix transcriptional regulator [Sulfurimonas sp.]
MEFYFNKVGEKVGENLTDNQSKIVKQMKLNPKISAKDLSSVVGISSRKIEENIKKLKEQNIIKRIGGAKGGHWEISSIYYEKTNDRQ